MTEEQQLHAIYLEAQDEITSVVDQMRSSPDQRLALVAGERLGLLQSRVNLQLLQRMSEEMNKEFVLVTSDPVTRNIAAQLGIEVYARLDDVEHGQVIAPTVTDQPSSEQSDKFPGDISGTTTASTSIPSSSKGLGDLSPKKKSKPKQDKGDKSQMIDFSSRKMGYTLLAFVAVPAAIIAIAAYVLLPSATIRVVPQTKQHTQAVEITATAEVAEVNFLSNEIPATYYESIREQAGTGEATETKKLGSKATGTVTIFNKGYSDAFSLIAGTKLTSYEGLEYVLTKDTYIPGSSLNAGFITSGKAENVAVRASKVGPEYNSEQTNFDVAGYSSGNVWAESYNTFSGGESHEGIVISQADYDKLRESILTQLVAQTEESLRSQLANGQEFLEESVQTKVIKENSSHEIGAEAGEFTLTIKVQAQGLAFYAHDIDAVVDRAIVNNIPANYMLMEGKEKEIAYTVNDLDFARRRIRFDGVGTVILARRLDEEAIKENIRGKTVEQATDSLGLFGNKIKTFDIKLGPFWVTRIPDSTNKITVELLTQADFDNSQQ